MSDIERLGDDTIFTMSQKRQVNSFLRELSILREFLGHKRDDNIDYKDEKVSIKENESSVTFEVNGVKISLRKDKAVPTIDGKKITKDNFHILKHKLDEAKAALKPRFALVHQLRGIINAAMISGAAVPYGTSRIQMDSSSRRITIGGMSLDKMPASDIGEKISADEAIKKGSYNKIYSGHPNYAASHEQTLTDPGKKMGVAKFKTKFEHADEYYDGELKRFRDNALQLTSGYSDGKQIQCIKEWKDSITSPKAGGDPRDGYKVECNFTQEYEKRPGANKHEIGKKAFRDILRIIMLESDNKEGWHNLEAAHAYAKYLELMYYKLYPIMDDASRCKLAALVETFYENARDMKKEGELFKNGGRKVAAGAKLDANFFAANDASFCLPQLAHEKYRALEEKGCIVLSTGYTTQGGGHRVIAKIVKEGPDYFFIDCNSGSEAVKHAGEYVAVVKRKITNPYASGAPVDELVLKEFIKSLYRRRVYSCESGSAEFNKLKSDCRKFTPDGPDNENLFFLKSQDSGNCTTASQRTLVMLEMGKDFGFHLKGTAGRMYNSSGYQNYIDRTYVMDKKRDGSPKNYGLKTGSKPPDDSLFSKAGQEKVLDALVDAVTQNYDQDIKLGENVGFSDCASSFDFLKKTFNSFTGLLPSNFKGRAGEILIGEYKDDESKSHRVTAKWNAEKGVTHLIFRSADVVFFITEHALSRKVAGVYDVSGNLLTNKGDSKEAFKNATTILQKYMSALKANKFEVNSGIAPPVAAVPTADPKVGHDKPLGAGSPAVHKDGAPKVVHDGAGKGGIGGLPKGSAGDTSSKPFPKKVDKISVEVRLGSNPKSLHKMQVPFERADKTEISADEQAEAMLAQFKDDLAKNPAIKLGITFSANWAEAEALRKYYANPIAANRNIPFGGFQAGVMSKLFSLVENDPDMRGKVEIMPICTCVELGGADAATFNMGKYDMACLQEKIAADNTRIYGWQNQYLSLDDDKFSIGGGVAKATWNKDNPKSGCTYVRAALSNMAKGNISDYKVGNLLALEQAAVKEASEIREARTKKSETEVRRSEDSPEKIAREKKEKAKANEKAKGAVIPDAPLMAMKRHAELILPSRTSKPARTRDIPKTATISNPSGIIKDAQKFVTKINESFGKKVHTNQYEASISETVDSTTVNVAKKDTSATLVSMRFSKEDDKPDYTKCDVKTINIEEDAFRIHLDMFSNSDGGTYTLTDNINKKNAAAIRGILKASLEVASVQVEWKGTPLDKAHVELLIKDCETFANQADQDAWIETASKKRPMIFSDGGHGHDLSISPDAVPDADPTGAKDFKAK